MVLALVFGRLSNVLSGDLGLARAYGGWSPPFDVEPVIAVFFVLVGVLLITFRRLGHYSRRRPIWQELGDVFWACTAAAVVHMAIVFLLKADFSRAWLLTTWGLIAIGVPTTRILIKRALLVRGLWVRRTVVVGTGRNARDAAVALASDSLLGYRIDAFFAADCGDTEPPERIDLGTRMCPVFMLDKVNGLLPEQFGRPHVTIALELDEMARCGDLVEKLNLYYGDVDVVSPLRGVPLTNTKMTHFVGHDILALRLYNNLSRPWPRLMKRGFDLVVGSLLLIACLPVMAYIAWHLHREGGPVFFSHRRVGLNGRPFDCHKFRSMVPDADRVLAELLERDPSARAEWERDLKLKTDPRITPMGAFLRKTSLDELPQLWNVVKGDMSLVGPRPITRAELARYDGDAVYYIEARPGLTGLWQISGRNDLDYDRRVHLDGWYVKNWNLWYDLIILAQTALVVVLRKGAY